MLTTKRGGFYRLIQIKDALFDTKEDWNWWQKTGKIRFLRWKCLAKAAVMLLWYTISYYSSSFLFDYSFYTF